jgi:hypothetical protein
MYPTQPTKYSPPQTPQQPPFSGKNSPFELVWSTAPNSKPLGHPSSSGFPSGDQTTPTYSQQLTFEPLRNPRLRQVAQHNAAAYAQQVAIFGQAQQMVAAEATRQASNAGKPCFYPFHPDLTPDSVANTEFSQHLHQLFNGYKNRPTCPDYQGMNLLALSAAGFTASDGGHGLFHAIREGLSHANGLKLITQHPSQSTYHGKIRMKAPHPPYKELPCVVTVICKKGQPPMVVKAHPLPPSAISQKQ